MNDEDHRAVLLSAIDDFLRGKSSAVEFRSRFYDYYVDVVPEWDLTDRERDFFSAVQEKLDWVDDAPDSHSRKHGWIDYSEFRVWLETLARTRHWDDG